MTITKEQAQQWAREANVIEPSTELEPIDVRQLTAFANLAAAHGAAQAKVPWVSVKDSLPPPFKQCLVYWGEAFGEPLIGVAMRCNPYHGDFLWHGHGGSHNEVTHWMPLPDAPKGEQA